MLMNTFTAEDFKMISRDPIYQGFISLIRYRLQFRLFGGGYSPIITRDVTERRAAAGVLLFNPEQDQVVLIEQFRPGALNNPNGPWLLEIVAGILEPNETPNEVAKREALEEAHCDVLDLYPICSYFASPGGSNEVIHLFCGRINAEVESGIHGLADEDEDIRTHIFKTEQAFQLLEKGYLKVSPAIIALQWLALNHKRLTELWLTN